MSRPHQIASHQHDELCDQIWTPLGSWHRFIVAVDGVDGAGKSTLARYIAWQLGMPAIETDIYLDPQRGAVAFHHTELERALQARLDLDRPVIIEGVLVLRTLRAIDLAPDFLVFVEQQDHDGSHGLASNIAAYMREHQPRENANFVFAWGPES